MMQRIKWIDMRLQAWAQWRAGSCGYRSPNYEYDGDAPKAGSVVEFNAEQEADAMEIDAAVAQLPEDLRKTVVAHYTWEGGMDQVAEKLRVTRATIHRRLCHADIRISDWLDWKRQHEQKKSRVA
ncbi:sigma-70 family RNA polymerase sigma factor [Paracandidimonas soli]|nr:sigma-70 family RNA polymerase sigma factor [Paracandidimonas soli]